ncbi:hypothetical protein REPUB_Repub06bG0179800 [Reevesia pubescens]
MRKPKATRYSRENSYVPSSSPIVDVPGVEENKSPTLAPANVDTPALETSDDGKNNLAIHYRAEDEPVEPYEDEENSWNGVNEVATGFLVGACVVGVEGFVYQKRKKDNIRTQYQCLANK